MVNHEGLVISGWYGLPAQTTKNDIERFTFPSTFIEQIIK